MAFIVYHFLGKKCAAELTPDGEIDSDSEDQYAWMDAILEAAWTEAGWAEAGGAGDEDQTGESEDEGMNL
jgi:hypothetical protein